MADQDPVIRRTISLRAFAGLYVVLTLVAIGVWVFGFAFELPFHPALIVIAGLLPLLIGVAYTWLVRATTEYRIYEDAIEVESGIFSKDIDHLQLFRVRDLGFHQSLLERILGIGTVTITSTDRSTPHLELRGITGAREVYESLRRLVSTSQATRRTMVIEEEPPGRW